MTTATAYAALDMLSTAVWNGVVTSYNSQQFVISDGTRTETYAGTFTYDFYGNVLGTLTSITETLNGTTTFTMTGLNVDAYAYSTAVNSGDAAAALDLVFAGNDRLNGSAYDDVLRGAAGKDTIFGNNGADSLMGETGNDSLVGGSGNDTLNGGSGNDTMNGGAGNDRFIVDSLTDSIVEAAGGGTDVVNSTLSWTLGANLENLVLLGTSAINGTGNSVANILTGNAGNNLLTGNAGNDSLVGNAGADTLNGGTGNDTLVGGAGNDQLNGAAGNDSLVGNSETDVLAGGDGDDTLVGGAQNDTLTGNAGADHFVFVATGSGGSGTDTITDFSSASGDVIEVRNLLVGTFEYRGSALFTAGGESEARFANGQVIFDLNGDGVADLRINLTGITLATQLQADDFLIS